RAIRSILLRGDVRNLGRIHRGGPYDGNVSKRTATVTDRALSERVACHDCDLLQQIPELAPGAKARCARCGHLLASQSADPLDRPLALTIAAAVAFILANTQSLMDLSAVGRFASTTIPHGAYEMWMQGQRITALIVAFCAVIAPGAYILFMLT